MGQRRAGGPYLAALLALAIMALVWWVDERHAPARGAPPLAAPPRADALPMGIYGSLTVKDSSGHQHDGVRLGRTVVGVPGHQRTAYRFGGPGAWVNVPSAPNPGQRDFAIAAWVNFADAPRSHDTFDIVRKGLSFTATGLFKLEFVDGGRVRCTAKDDRFRKARVTSPQTGLADRTWHRIGCARVGPTWSVIVDGVATTKHAPLGAISNEASLSIGSKYGLEDMAESVDDVAFHIRPPAPIPPAADVAQRIEQMQADTPVARWLLDEVQQQELGSA